MNADKQKQTGPVYGVELIDSLPIGNSGFKQAMPGRKDLEQVRKSNERVAAGYEVLLAHYQELKKTQRDWIHYETERPPEGVPVLFCNVSDSDEYERKAEIGVWKGQLKMGGTLVMETEAYGWFPADHWQPLPAIPNRPAERGGNGIDGQAGQEVRAQQSYLEGRHRGNRSIGKLRQRGRNHANASRRDSYSKEKINNKRRGREGGAMKFIRRVRLFVNIVWRESPAGMRMDWRTAWKVAKIIH